VRTEAAHPGQRGRRPQAPLQLISTPTPRPPSAPPPSGAPSPSAPPPSGWRPDGSGDDEPSAGSGPPRPHLVPPPCHHPQLQA
jgi:hypothetical protein